MLRDNNDRQTEFEMVCIETLVPDNHLLRKINRYTDFKVVRDKLKSFYCENNGRPAIDPVVLFKIYLLGFLYGIRSERQLMRDIEVNLAYRWFLGYKITDSVPHHSTLSLNRIKRFQNSNVFQELFDETVFMAIRKNLVVGEILYTDSTHLKANANKKKFVRQDVEGTARSYLEELEEAINTDRQEHGKKDMKEKSDEIDMKNTRVSTTDPESGFLVRDGKEECFAYLDHRTVDGQHNIITDVHVTPGNLHDSIPYISRLDLQIDKFNFNVKAVGLDAGYNTAALCHELVKRDIFGAIGYRAPSSNKDYFRKKHFKYDKTTDCYTCPNKQKLVYRTTRRDGYREYVSDSKICTNCELLGKCTASRQRQKILSRHVWEDDKNIINQNRLTEHGKKIYQRRKETVERSFADAKQLHGYRYARFRGLWKVGFQCLMTAICQNLKKIAMILDKADKKCSEIAFFTIIWSIFIEFRLFVIEFRQRCKKEYKFIF